MFAIAEETPAAAPVRSFLRAVVDDERSIIDILMAALKDGSHIVRENAIDELEELQARDAVPALRLLLDDSHRDVRAAARHALQTLADG